MFRRFDPDPGASPVQAGLNQLTAYAAKTLTHDTKGNVTGFGTDTFGYSSENLLTSATVGGTATTLAYDPLLRLYQSVSGATTSRFAYDGVDAIAEYDGANALQRRWVFDPTTGQPHVWYEGTGTAATDRRYLSADERGSIISVSDSAGASLSVNSYDEFGNPAASNLGRFGYTGQAWLPSAKLWYYKARVYHPALGRFLQTDPIGYEDSPNLYAYVRNDPINWIDPLGLQTCSDENVDTASDGSGGDTGCPPPDPSTDIVVTGKAIEDHLTPTPDPMFQIEVAELNRLQKVFAKAVYSRNPKIRRNLKQILKRLTGKTFTDAQIDRVLNDILRGKSTTLDGLAALGKISAGSDFTLTPTHVRIIDTYIRELPSSPLNNQIKQLWQARDQG